jgi:hypothetical protein
MTLLSNPICGLSGLGGCTEPLSLGDAFRCLDCREWFHETCLARHFRRNQSKETVA